MRRAVLPFWLLLLALGLWQVLHTPVHTDLSGFLPDDSQGIAQRLLEAVQSGPGTRLILVGLEGAAPEPLAEASAAVAGRLRASGLFARVENGTRAWSADEEAQLFRYRYLLADVPPEAFTPEPLHDALRARLRELAAPVPLPDKARLPQDPTASFRNLLRDWQPSGGPTLHQGVWFSPDRQRALLLLESRADSLDLEAQSKVVAAIEQAAAENGTRARLAGPGAFAVAASETIRADSRFLSIAASLVVAALLLVAYRSPRLLVLSALPLLSAMVAGMATVGLLFGSMHGIALALGVSLIGVAVDYPLHLFAHLQADRSPRTAMAHIWPTLRLGAVTTSMGYLALATAPFEGLAQLGAFAMAGLLTSALVTRWVLPPLLTGQQVPGGVPAPFRSGRAGSTGGIARVALLAGGAALLTFALHPNPWEDDPGALSPLPREALSLDRELRHQLGAGEATTLVVVTGDDAETVLRRSEALRPALDALVHEGALGGYDMAARYLPSTYAQRSRQATLPTPHTLDAALRQASAGLPFRVDTFAPFLADMDAARRLAPLRPADLTEGLLALKLQSLLSEDAQGWYGLVPLRDIRQRVALTEAVAGHEGIAFVDLRSTTRERMARLRGEALERLGWGLAAVTAVLLLGLRAPARVGRALIPVGVAIAVTLTVLLVGGERLTLFHLIALALVAGIGVDFGLFFGRPEADAATRARTTRGLLTCAMSSVAVFGILATSHIPVLNAIGLTVAIGVSTAFLAAYYLAATHDVTAPGQPTPAASPHQTD
jgi:predicted exporter